MIFEPRLHGTCQIHNLPAEVNLGQAMIAFEVFDYIPVVACNADLWDTEKLDQFLFCHDAGARDKLTVWAGYDSCEFSVFLNVVHG